MTTKPTPITLANDPLAPYLIAPGWRVGDLLFLSGQASIGPDGSIVGIGDFDAQLAQTFANIATALAAGGSDEGQPGFRATYGPRFYVSYLRDPQGNKIALFSDNPAEPGRDDPPPAPTR